MEDMKVEDKGKNNESSHVMNKLYEELDAECNNKKLRSLMNLKEITVAYKTI